MTAGTVILSDIKSELHYTYIFTSNTGCQQY